MNHYFDPTAEVALLSILIRNPEAFYELNTVKKTMFSSTPNQIIYETIEELNLQNISPEYNMLRNNLESRGKLKDAGQQEYLDYLVRQDYDAKNIKEYERLVVDSHRARRLSELNKELNSSLGSGMPVGDVINRVKGYIDGLTSTVAGNQISSIAEIAQGTFQEIVKRVDNPGLTGWTTGLSTVDNVTGGIAPGDVWIIASRPSMGKSATVCNMALNTAKAGNPTAIFSLEMMREKLVERMIAIETGIDYTDIRFGLLDKQKLDRIYACIDVLKVLPIHIDSNFSCSLDYFIGTTRKLHRHHGVKTVFLDYIQLLAERSNQAVHELGQISRSAKLLANDLQIGFVICSQLNRGVEMRDDKRPQLSDLRQSGNLEEDADLVAFLYRDEYYNPDTKHKGILEFIIRKQRQGSIGTLPLLFQPSSQIIKEKK